MELCQRVGKIQISWCERWVKFNTGDFKVMCEIQFGKMKFNNPIFNGAI